MPFVYTTISFGPKRKYLYATSFDVFVFSPSASYDLTGEMTFNVQFFPLSLTLKNLVLLAIVICN